MHSHHFRTCVNIALHIHVVISLRKLGEQDAYENRQRGGSDLLVMKGTHRTATGCSKTRDPSLVLLIRGI